MRSFSSLDAKPGEYVGLFHSDLREAEENSRQAGPRSTPVLISFLQLYYFLHSIITDNPSIPKIEFGNKKHLFY